MNLHRDFENLAMVSITITNMKPEPEAHHCGMSSREQTHLRTLKLKKTNRSERAFLPSCAAPLVHRHRRRRRRRRCHRRANCRHKSRLRASDRD